MAEPDLLRRCGRRLAMPAQSTQALPLSGSVLRIALKIRIDADQRSAHLTGSPPSPSERFTLPK
jgi:hypothetical protein